MKRLLLPAVAVIAFGLLANANAAWDPNSPVNAAASTPAISTVPALVGWKVDSAPFIASLRQARGAKAASDRLTIFRPVTPCRLVDTRGFGAAVAVVGPLNPATTSNVNSAGACGIPASGMVSGLSVSVAVQNLTPNNGGFITLQAQGAAPTGLTAVFSPGAPWLTTTANVSILDNSGNFSMYVAGSQVHVIVDVNGYYQDLNELDSTTQMDITADTAGDALGVLNVGVGNGIYTSTNAANGNALTIGQGRLRVQGAGLNTNTAAFIHVVNSTAAFGAGGTACGGFPGYSVIDHPMLNGTGENGALVFITARDSASLPTATGASYGAMYFTGGCTPDVNGYWGIRDFNGVAIPNGAQFNVLVIRP